MSPHTAALHARSRHVLRIGLRLFLTLLVVLGAVAAGAVGWQTLAARAAAVEGPAPAPPTTVATDTIRMQDSHAAERRVAGQFEPRQETALGFEVPGSVAKVLVREGDVVADGQVLARLDTRLLQAERAQQVAARDGLVAQAELARRTDARRAELRDRGFATDQDVDATSLDLLRLEAGIAEIDARLAAIDVRIEKSAILAPFAGRIGRRDLDTGAVVAAGVPVLTLLQAGQARFRAGLPPDLAETLPPGTEIVVETRDGPLPARLSHLAPDLDPATRTRAAYFDVETTPPPARSTGTLVLVSEERARGAWVPTSALRAGPRGTWQILVVDEDGRIGVEAAEIVHAAEGRAYIRGTFGDGATYLTGGTTRVVPGEPVRVVASAVGAGR
jgi:RND family efflux transporter MFP subunit